jgi:NADH pyrophosphatase NudC (nudix superfamily)
MAYMANLSDHQQVLLHNQGNQTLVTLVSSSPGQQQSQSNTITTGHWQKPPQLFKTKAGFILQIESETGTTAIQIQSSGISTLTDKPKLKHQQSIALESIDDELSQGQKPLKFKPMQPMKMGNMSMSMNPMSMQMGNMSLNMGEELKSSPAAFCTQCGQQVATSDRFCGNCGHQLKD